MEKELEIYDRVILESTELSESDFKIVTEINRWLLTPLGVWPMNEHGYLRKFLPHVISTICYMLIFFLLIPSAMHMFLVEKNTKKRMKAVGSMSFCVMAILKYGFLIMRRDKIRNCLNHISADWRRIVKSEEREIMNDDAKTGRFIATLCAMFMYSGGFFFRTILPFAVPRGLLPDNSTIRPLANSIHQSLLNTQKSPNYEIAFTTQWFAGLVVYTVTVASCSIAAVFTLHACGQLKIVMSRLNGFVENSLREAKTANNKLGEIVELHLRVLQFIVEIEGILNGICFVEFIGCTLNICVLGYHLITEIDQGKAATIAIVTYSFLITSFTFNIFIYCHIGELLNQQGKKVGTTVYLINWYELRGTGASGLILILAMANSPVNITAGKMVELSYGTFCNVLKTAMAYFNFLSSVIL